MPGFFDFASWNKDAGNAGFQNWEEDKYYLWLDRYGLPPGTKLDRSTTPPGVITPDGVKHQWNGQGYEGMPNQPGPYVEPTAEELKNYQAVKDRVLGRTQQGLGGNAAPSTTNLQTAAAGNIYGSVANARAYDVDPSAFGPSAALTEAGNLMRGQAGGNDPVRAQQMGLIQQLQDQAAGRGPSLAQMQLQQASQQNLNQALSQQAAQRGLGRGAAQRQMIGMRAGVGQNLAAQSAMARLQEQMAARGMLGQQLSGVRGQDMSAMNALYGQAKDARDALIERERQKGANRNTFNTSMIGALGAAGNISGTPWQREQVARAQQEQLMRDLARGGAAAAESIANAIPKHGSGGGSLPPPNADAIVPTTAENPADWKWW